MMASPRESDPRLARPERVTGLVFVYDAPSGKLGALADSLKKLVGKGCPLCAVTHGLFDRKASWISEEASLGVAVTYRHRDETADIDLPPGTSLPVVLAEVQGEKGRRLAVLLDADAIARCNGTATDLKGRLAFRMASLGLELPAARS